MLQIINLVVSTVMLPSIRSRSAFNLNSASFACVLSFSSCLYGSSSALLHIWQTCGVTCVNQNLKCMVYKGSRGTSCWQLVWNAKIVLERSLNPPSRLPGQVARLLWCTSLCIWGRAWQTCFPQPFHEGYLPRWIQAPGKSTFFAVFNLASLLARHHSL